MIEKPTSQPEHAERASKQKVFDAVPEKQREQIIDADHAEALDLMDEAESLYRESELGKVRRVIEGSEARGAKWSEEDVAEYEREALGKLGESTPKEFIDEAVAADQLADEIEQALPDDFDPVMANEAHRWGDFLEKNGRQNADVAIEAVETAKEFEEAFAESPHSLDFQLELRDRLFHTLEKRRAQHSESLDESKAWMLDAIRTGRAGAPERLPNEVLSYTQARAKVWGKRLFGSIKRGMFTGVVVVSGALVPPLGAAMVAGAVGIAAYEGIEGMRERLKQQKKEEAKQQTSEQRGRKAPE